MSGDFFDAQGMFERAFKPVDGGYLFYPWRWSGGYLITPEEFEALKENARQISRTRTVLMMVGAVLAIITAAIVADAQLGTRISEGPWLGIGTASVICVPLLWKAYAPQRLVRGRKPVAPPLTREEKIRERARIFSPQFMRFSMGVTVIMMIIGLRKIGDDPWLGAPLIVIFGLLFAQNFWALWQQRNTDA